MSSRNVVSLSLLALCLVVCVPGLVFAEANEGISFTEKGQVGYTLAETTSSYKSLDYTHLVYGSDNQMGEYIKTVKNEKTKSFLNDKFSSSKEQHADFRSRYNSDKLYKTSSKSETSEKSEWNVAGVKGGESSSKVTREWNRDKKKSSEIESAMASQADKYLKDNKILTADNGDSSMKKDTSQKLGDNPVLAHTKVELYEDEYGKFSLGVYGYDNNEDSAGSSFHFLGVEGGGEKEVSFDKDGLKAEIDYEVDAAVFKYEPDDPFVLHEGGDYIGTTTVTPEVAIGRVYVEGEAEVSASLDGVKGEVSGEVGAMAVEGSISGKQELLGGFITLEGGVSGGVGAKAKFAVDGELSWDRIGFSHGAGLAWGLGGDYQGGISINPKVAWEWIEDPVIGAVDEVGDFIEDSRGWLTGFWDSSEETEGADGTVIRSDGVLVDKEDGDGEVQRSGEVFRPGEIYRPGETYRPGTIHRPGDTYRPPTNIERGPRTSLPW